MSLAMARSAMMSPALQPMPPWLNDLTIDVLPHPVPVHHHGRAAVDDEHAHVAARVDPGGREQLVEAAEHDGLGIRAGLGHQQPRRAN
jgi:hypothetical protein